MLGRPIEECNALLVPTAMYGHPACSPTSVWNAITGQQGMGPLGWKSVGVLDLTALPSIGADRWVPWVKEADALLLEGGDAALGIVDFSIFPHLDYPDWPDNTLESARTWATKIPGPAYAIDDETAISVIDDSVEVVSEGHWEQLNAG